MKYLILCALISLLSLNAMAQLPDRWHDLILDQSTPEDVIKVLGQPKDDKTDKLMIVGNARKWITKRQGEKIFRMLEYDLGKESGIQKAKLYFLDAKLVCIDLAIKSGQISPNALPNIYGVKFTPMISGFELGASPEDFERNQGKIYPKSYPVVYEVAAVSEHSFVNVMINNSSFGSILGKSMGVPNTPQSFPGTVATVWLISRTLENRDGANILK